MSFNRDNVTWQGADGRWSIGFFAVAWVGDDDPEWDVEYDHGRFDWISTGHPTEQAAFRAWNGANPGGTTIYAYDPDRPDVTARFDRMAADLKAARR